MKDATMRQIDALRVIRDEIARCGVAPSVREIAVALKLTNPSAAAQHVDALFRKRLVDRDAGRTRTLRLTPAGHAALAPPTAVPVYELGPTTLDAAAELGRVVPIGEGVTLALLVTEAPTGLPGLLLGDLLFVASSPRPPVGSVVAVRRDGAVALARVIDDAPPSSDGMLGRVVAMLRTIHEPEPDA